MLPFFFILGYGQTKWVAERIVGLARDEFNVPVIIARAGLIGGNSTTGGCASEDLTVFLLKAMVVTGCRPDGAFRITLTPVDLVSHGIVQAAMREECYGSVFHMIHRQLISLQDMADVLELCGYKLSPLKYREWVERLKEKSEEHMVPWQLLASLNPHLDHWDTYLSRGEQCDELLKDKEAELLPSSKVMLSATVVQLLKQGVLEKPPMGEDRIG